jgi:hypothetical protein
MNDTTGANMDNPELLQRLIKEQHRTNRLLAMAEYRARKQDTDAERAKIAEREGVEPSQVILGDLTYCIVRRPAGQ